VEKGIANPVATRTAPNDAVSTDIADRIGSNWISITAAVRRLNFDVTHRGLGAPSEGRARPNGSSMAKGMNINTGKSR